MIRTFPPRSHGTFGSDSQAGGELATKQPEPIGLMFSVAAKTVANAGEMVYATMCTGEMKLSSLGCELQRDKRDILCKR